MKKLCFLLCITFIGIHVTAQTNAKATAYSPQLKKILHGVQKDFQDFKGEKLKEKDGDIIFTSTITIAGTTDNQVMDFASGKSYLAKLGEGLNEKEAKALIENWKKKISSAATEKFDTTPDDQQNSEYKRIAYMFTGDASSISVYAMKYADDENYSAYLLVMKL